MPVKLLPRGGDGRISCGGKVSSTLGVVDDRTRARRVRIIPDGACAMLVPGAFIDVSFTSAALGTDAPRILAIPKEAIIDVRGVPTTFVAQPQAGAFVPRFVRVGRATTEDVAIEEGLVEGDSVVVVGALLLKGEMLRSELE
jgi:cobalt-zinc-cadmium efflux system membrane fusion protein